ncbi:hypothetical protein ACHQM5_029282 [Ranunculus cassubicifolius]
MAEDDSTFLEIFCKSSGKIRRFAKGTDSQFALQLINDRLVNDNVALPASYIQAVKDGEEPIFFGPKSILIDYGDGWKLETVLSKGFEHENVLEPTLEQAAADKGISPEGLYSPRPIFGTLVYPSLPSPEPLSLIVSNYGSDEEEREWAASDPNGDYPDLTEAFTTQTDFGGKDEIVEWCKKVGSENGTVIIIGRSDCEKSGRRPRVFLRCERSGTVKARRRVQTEERVIQKRQRNTPTKKCDCPFMIKATLLNNGKWEVKVECGTHNHPLLESIDGHPTYARLTEEEAKLVTQLSIAGFKPSQMLDALKRRDPNNVSTLPTIYNFRAKRGLTKTTRKPWEMVPSP